ncbi:MAG: hypothetical protein DRQ47_10715 [Gammaproteobacteria bacterium]|nr:MAG: hypothetical protein DRQ47_10715 [Gammaproteobacteria bacterium]
MIKNWTKWRPAQKRIIPANLASWLTETGSLTRRLQENDAGDFSVQFMGGHWLPSLPDETVVLEVAHTELVYQREVRLMLGNTAAVYARTLIPRTTFNAMRHRFLSLGNQSLGEMLFTDPTVVRGPIAVACLKPGQWLYEMAVREEKKRPDKLWARRSSFYLNSKVLLVNEVFLTDLICDS